VALAQSDAEKSLDKLKTLAGSWEGHVVTLPLQADIEGKLMQVSLRATSMGNALMQRSRELEGLRTRSPCSTWTGTACS